MPFYTSVAVSPFKYTEADCAYQYLKLEKKIAAGADYAVTQLGFDARKFRELKRISMSAPQDTGPRQRLCSAGQGSGEVLEGRASGLLGIA